MPDSPSSRLAVLIDADNAQASRVDGLLAETGAVTDEVFPHARRWGSDREMDE